MFMYVHGIYMLQAGLCSGVALQLALALAALPKCPRLKRPKCSFQSATQHHDPIDLLSLGATGQAPGVPVALQAAEAKPLVP